MPVVNTQHKAMAIYLDFITKKALQLALARKNLNFDLQGRVLVEVRLAPLEIEGIIGQINYELDCNFDPSNEGLVEAIGREVTEYTTVSVDCAQNPALYNRFSQQISTALVGIHSDQRQSILKSLTEQPRGSIIALQQEFHFHLALTKRIYQKIPRFAQISLDKAYKSTLNEVNQLILTVYAQALTAAVNRQGSLDYSHLNQLLDKARASILPEAHTLLMNNIIKYTHSVLTPAELNSKQLKHNARATVATGNDLVHVDKQQSLVTYIGGSEHTAHERRPGAALAHRQLITCLLDQDNRVTENPNSRIQVRIPTPAITTGLIRAADYAEDVAEKLAALSQYYQLDQQLPSIEGLPTAFVYNRYTAINDVLGDMNGNLQTRSASHITFGVHSYNRKQLKSDTPVFCLLQNISVNGFGDELGYENDSYLTVELTLMAEMALLHTLYETVTPNHQKAIKSIFALYIEYLKEDESLAYFSRSAAGISVKSQIQLLKDQLRDEANENVENDVYQNAQSCLLKLLAHDLHQRHEYATLVQVLSVFLTQASVGGCKSGNERAQSVNGRVAILDHCLSANGQASDVTQSLAKLAESDDDFMACAQELKSTLDRQYNRCGLQTAASLVSLVDQGASAKLRGKPNHHLFVSRNLAETQAGVMTNLHQTNASDMQAHKGLTQEMQDAWSGRPLSIWERLRSSPFKIAGAILAILTIVPALIIGLYNLIDNYFRKKNTAMNNSHLSHYNEADEAQLDLSSSSLTMARGLNHSSTNLLAAVDELSPLLPRNADHGPVDHADEDSDSSSYNPVDFELHL